MLYGGWRTAILLASLLEVSGRFALIYLLAGGRVSTAGRAAWLHASCARIARRLGLSPVVKAGEGAGLTVSNHLTYLDILVYGAARPFLFVPKSEVRRWPVLGTLAALGGTVFVDRSRSLKVAKASRQIEEGLRGGDPGAALPRRYQLRWPLGPAFSASAVRPRDPRRRLRDGGCDPLPRRRCCRGPRHLLGRHGLFASPLSHPMRPGSGGRDRV
jgi:Acyltransferase